jgi:hypothetical protein
MFTPDGKKCAIAKRVESSLGSKLEDLVVAVWIVYSLTRNDSNSEPHQMALGIINKFAFHEFGWSTSKLIPSRLALEGDDATLDDRITQYCDIARRHEDDIRPDLVMMLGFVFLMSRNRPDDMMDKWVLESMRRHDIQADSFTDKNPLHGHVVLQQSDQIH